MNLNGQVFLTLQKKPELKTLLLSKQQKGAIYLKIMVDKYFTKDFKALDAQKFSAKEGIVWSAIIQGVKKNVGSSFNDVLLQSNKIAKDNNLDLSIDSNEMMRILHRMWKLSLVTFSETEDI